ncbi:MAG: ComC/BlpC family leader-containing pheromone/bacteriocin [Bacteroidales bacterium]|nr:ComC/BlpC family leader-containing pheromone/bacteriocin [Bacteroidales bacterium]
MKNLVKKTEKKEMRNFVILKTKELVKIKGGQGTPIDHEID